MLPSPPAYELTWCVMDQSSPSYVNAQNTMTYYLCSDHMHSSICLTPTLQNHLHSFIFSNTRFMAKGIEQYSHHVHHTPNHANPEGHDSRWLPLANQHTFILRHTPNFNQTTHIHGSKRYSLTPRPWSALLSFSSAVYLSTQTNRIPKPRLQTMPSCSPKSSAASFSLAASCSPHSTDMRSCYV